MSGQTETFKKKIGEATFQENYSILLTLELLHAFS